MTASLDQDQDQVPPLAEQGPERTVVPDSTGHYGPYGGRFVPEALVAALDELLEHYASARADPAFATELASLQSRYAGRPTPVTEAARLSQAAGERTERGAARILLKREDLAHTGSHKINNV